MAAPDGRLEPLQEDQVDAPEPVASAEYIHVHPVDKRSDKVFKALFHISQSEKGDLAGAVKWDEFKRAMVRIGFSTEKLQGSAWQFTPGDTLNIIRGINFYEPHPDSNIPYIMARRFGRQLERVYS